MNKANESLIIKQSAGADKPANYDKGYAKALRKLKKNRTAIVIFIIATLVALIMIYPLFWMVSASLKYNSHVYNTGLFYSDWQFNNYSSIFKEVPIRDITLARSIINSLVIAIPPLIVNIIVCVFAAFAFSKLRFRGQNAAFMIMLSTMMIPFAVVMIPQFVLFKMLGLISTGAWALIIPKMFGGIYTIFFLRQYMYGIPDSLIEAAKIDGATYIFMVVKIIIPLCMPVLITQFILGFIGAWGDYMGPLIFIRDRRWWTVPLVVSRFSSGISGEKTDLPKLMAASIIAMLPIFIVFSIFQKKIINSVMLSGMKL